SVSDLESTKNSHVGYLAGKTKQKPLIGKGSIERKS
ncbi:MAG: hypothetical protein RI931_478, partial [Actinomycetota bacterium]